MTPTLTLQKTYYKYKPMGMIMLLLFATLMFPLAAVNEPALSRFILLFFLGSFTAFITYIFYRKVDRIEFYEDRVILINDCHGIKKEVSCKREDFKIIKKNFLPGYLLTLKTNDKYYFLAIYVVEQVYSNVSGRCIPSIAIETNTTGIDFSLPHYYENTKWREKLIGWYAERMKY